MDASPRTPTMAPATPTAPDTLPVVHREHRHNGALGNGARRQLFGDDDDDDDVDVQRVAPS